MEKDYKNWNDAYRDGFSLVIRAMRIGDEPQDDMQLGRLAAKALLVGIDRQWIEDMLSIGCEENIANLVKRRTH